MEKQAFVIIIIFVLVALVIGFFIWAYVLFRNYQECINGASSYCPSLYCDFPSTQCGNYPYRINSETGEIVCDYYVLNLAAPVVQVPSGGGGGGG